MVPNDAKWCFLIASFRKIHQSSLSLNDDLFRKPTWISLVLMRDFSKTHQSSLTLKGGSTSHLGLLPSGEKRKPPYSVLKPLRYKVGGPSEVFASSRAAVCGMRPHGYKSLTGCLVLARSLLGTCSKLFRKPTWISLVLMTEVLPHTPCFTLIEQALSAFFNVNYV